MTSARAGGQPPVSPPARRAARVLGAAILIGAVLTAPLLGSVPPASAGEPAVGVRTVDEPDEMPIRVSLTRLTPAAIPERGKVTLAGRLTNSSSSTWEDVNVMPFVSSQPITTRDELAAAAATRPEAVVGSRLTDPGTYARLEDLEPGARARFRLRVPVESLHVTGEPGVYWIGVHVFGTDEGGRGLIGLARSFIPLVPKSLARRKNTSVSMVIPLRDRVRRAPDGRLALPDRWARLTSPGGRLARIADLATTTGEGPVSWLVDPAVLDAVADLANGNPALGLGASAHRPRESPPSTTATDADAGPAAPTKNPAGTGSRGTGSDSPSPAVRADAKSTLQRLTRALRSGDLMVLGYADPDAVSLARRAPALLLRAHALTDRRLTARELTGTATTAPADGYFDTDLFQRLTDQSLVMLSDQGDLEEPVASRLPRGQDLVLSDARASAGGPGPTRAHDPLALRQRILAEASLELYSAAPRPVVVSLPARWDPGGDWRAAKLFEVLRRTAWVRVSSPPRDAAQPFSGTLSYSRTLQAEEVSQANLSATRRLIGTGRVVDHLLTDHTDIADRLSGAALGASSWFVRTRPGAAVAQSRALDAAVRARLGRVTIVGTDFVTLSSGSGTLTVALVNGLDQPITVGIKALADPAVKVHIPAPVKMGPGQRTTLRLSVTSTAGVHDVTLQPVTTQGETAGESFRFSLRTSEVSRLIWYIVIAGTALLAVMISRRIVLRIRNKRWRSEERAATTSSGVET